MGAGGRTSSLHTLHGEVAQWGLFSQAIGFAFLAIALPPVACIIATTVAWHYLDPVTPRVLALVSKLTVPLWQKLNLTRIPVDAFMVNLALLHGVGLPCLFGYCLWDTAARGSPSLWLAYLYHVLRIGPYFTGFAYAYTMCHKEGHTRLGIFTGGRLSWVWNYWIGMFYGVLPTTFTYGHSVNHHQYNNSEQDTVSTWDQPRDSFLNYVRYLPRWLLYSANITPAAQFAKEGKTSIMWKMVTGTVVWLGGLATLWSFNPLFCVLYVVYPFVESALLLSAINWAWHCFLDPDEDNIYAYSVTILEGEPQTNILNEDFHVVHHQYPAAHWTDHPKMFEKHKAEYISKQATILRGTHAIEIFFLAILKKYDVFAEKFIDLSGKLTLDQKREIVIRRLQHVQWGTAVRKEE